MSSRAVRRYSLIVKDLVTNKEYLIKIREKNEKTNEFVFNDRSFLTMIDNRTTDFNDKNHLLKYLREKGYIDFEYGDIYITYKHDKKRRKLDLVYKEHELLKPFASNYQTYIDTSDRNFIKFYNQFLSDVRKGRFYRYLIKNKYIHEKLQEYLRDYLYNDNKLSESKLIRELSRYKVMRGYILAKSEFNRLYNNKTNCFQPMKEEEPIKLNIDSDDEFLNGIDNYDEVTHYYDLDDLEGIEIDGKPIFDGLYNGDEEEKPKVKKLEQ